LAPKFAFDCCGLDDPPHEFGIKAGKEMCDNNEAGIHTVIRIEENGWDLYKP
jgi:hypothetical protein